MTSLSNQTATSVASNASYFLDHFKEYHDSVASIDTYRTLHDFLSARVSGVRELLDIGNGGVFAYDTSPVGSITAIDLFLEDLPPDVLSEYFPKNAVARNGSALALPEPDGKFDMVLMVMLLHHLTGSDWRISWTNACRAIDEAWRVLKPGGRLHIMESCIPRWFFHVEKPGLWLLTRAAKTVLGHPVTFQFPPSMISDELKKKTNDLQVTRIPKGRYILQYGIKVPSFITPVMMYSFEATKPLLPT